MIKCDLRELRWQDVTARAGRRGEQHPWAGARGCGQRGEPRDAPVGAPIPLSPPAPCSLLSLPDTRLPHRPAPATVLLTQILPEPPGTRNGAWKGCSPPSQTPGSLSWERKVCEQQPRAISAPVLHPARSAKSQTHQLFADFCPKLGEPLGMLGWSHSVGSARGDSSTAEESPPCPAECLFPIHRHLRPAGQHPTGHGVHREGWMRGHRLRVTSHFWPHTVLLADYLHLDFPL